MNTTPIQHETFKDFIDVSFDKIPQGLIVADIACGQGGAGARMLSLNANFVKFIDARPYPFYEGMKNWNKDETISNFSFNRVDIEDELAFSNSIVGTDVIIYIGHLYHSINPTMIIDTITKSSAKYLVIESKMNNPVSFEAVSTEPGIIKVMNNTSYDHSAWVSGNEQWVEVSQPNFAFTKKYLEDSNWNIEGWCKVMVNAPAIPNVRPEKEMQRYGFFCTR